MKKNFVAFTALALAASACFAPSSGSKFIAATVLPPVASMGSISTTSNSVKSGGRLL